MFLELYFNQNKSYRQIAQEARICPRDIKTIVDKASNEKERQQHKSLSTQAYELFSKGKRPVEIATELNIRENEVTQYHREYSSLIGLDILNQIYREVKDDILHFVNLYRSAKSAGMGIPHIINLLNIANNSLPSVQYKYYQLQRQITILRLDRQCSAKEFQNLTDQTVAMGNRLDSIHLECQNEATQMHQLYQKRMKLEALVRQFENDNGAYSEIRKTVKENVTDTLSDRKELLWRAVLCVVESIRNEPDKFSPLIYYKDDTSSTTAGAYYNRQCYSPYTHVQQQYSSYDSFKQAYLHMLKEESENLFTSLEKILVDESLDQSVSKTSVAPSSFLMLPFDDKQQQKSSS